MLNKKDKQTKGKIYFKNKIKYRSSVQHLHLLRTYSCIKGRIVYYNLNQCISFNKRIYMIRDDSAPELSGQITYCRHLRGANWAAPCNFVMLLSDTTYSFRVFQYNTIVIPIFMLFYNYISYKHTYFSR